MNKHILPSFLAKTSIRSGSDVGITSHRVMFACSDNGIILFTYGTGILVIAELLVLAYSSLTQHPLLF